MSDLCYTRARECLVVCKVLGGEIKDFRLVLVFVAVCRHLCICMVQPGHTGLMQMSLTSCLYGFDVLLKRQGSASTSLGAV